MSNTKEVDWAVTELCANLCNEAYYDKVKMIAYLKENNIKYSKFSLGQKTKITTLL